MLRIAPSILSADFAKLGEEIRDVERAGADWIHIDVMDGHFVPNLTLGPLIVQAIRPVTELPFDVHLMIERPDNYIPEFAAAGADYISVHVEASRHLHRTIYLIREHGAKPGIVLNPATPLAFAEPVLEEVELILLMTVNPGFGGQRFIESSLVRIRELRTMLERKGLSEQIRIEVDGGINELTAVLAADAGADVLVAGSAIFSHPDRASAIAALRAADRNLV